MRCGRRGVVCVALRCVLCVFVLCACVSCVLSCLHCLHVVKLCMVALFACLHVTMSGSSQTSCAQHRWHLPHCSTTFSGPRIGAEHSPDARCQNRAEPGGPCRKNTSCTNPLSWRSLSPGVEANSEGEGGEGPYGCSYW